MTPNDLLVIFIDQLLVQSSLEKLPPAAEGVNTDAHQTLHTDFGTLISKGDVAIKSLSLSGLRGPCGRCPRNGKDGDRGHQENKVP